MRTGAFSRQVVVTVNWMPWFPVASDASSLWGGKQVQLKIEKEGRNNLLKNVGRPGFCTLRTLSSHCGFVHCEFSELPVCWESDASSVERETCYHGFL